METENIVLGDLLLEGSSSSVGDLLHLQEAVPPLLVRALDTFAYRFLRVEDPPRTSCRLE